MILEFGLASLAGYEWLQDLNLGPRPLAKDQSVEDAWDIEFRHYTTVSRFLYDLDEEEVTRALRLSPLVVGINNRNLRDFSVDLATFGRLRPLLPDATVAVGESGVRTAAAVRRLAEMGADAVLVGEALVTAPDVAAKVRELVAGGVL